MRAYSMDPCPRVVAARAARDGARRRIAARSSVSRSRAREPLRQRRETGSIEPEPHGGGHPRAVDGPADGGSARRPGPTTTPRSGSRSGPPASPAPPRPCLGRWSGRGSRGKRATAGGRAGPPGAERRAIRPARRVRGGRPGPTGLRRRGRGLDGDGPHARPGPRRRAGRRAGAARPRGGVTPTAAVRLDGGPERPSTARPAPPASRPTSSEAWCPPRGRATS
jgi:hypothetical protein